MSKIIALDVGGSSIKSGIVTATQQVLDIQQTTVDSKGTADHILSTLAGVVAHYLASTPDAKGVGIGFPSPFDYENGISLIEGVDKYEAIYGVDVRQAIREHLDKPELIVRFRNDAESALIGEALFGAGQPYRRFIGLTLGTGMGSSFIADGERITSINGVPDDGFLFPVKFRGEQADEWFSTRGVLRRFARANLPYERVADAAKASETSVATQAVWGNFGRDLAIFIQPFLTTFEADALLVAGGIANAMPYFGEALIAGVDVPVVRGSLGAHAALLGASALIG
ncbi:MAG: ROK family protein [Chloroflexota bacterium]